jgi:hypothetical protein
MRLLPGVFGPQNVTLRHYQCHSRQRLHPIEDTDGTLRGDQVHRKGKSRTQCCMIRSYLSLWLPDEAEIETEQEEDEMDDGATPADLRCFDKICP